MKPYQKITLIYLIFGALWIFFSDKLIGLLAFDRESMTLFQTAKGWIYVLLTSAMLYCLIYNSYNDLIAKEQEKRNIYVITMRAVCHILNNFLNKMMYFKFEMDKHDDIDHKIVELHEKVIKETSIHIQKMGAISNITEEEIEKVAYEDVEKKQ